MPAPLALQERLADRLVFAKVRERLGGRLRLGVSGAAPLAEEVLEFFHALGILVVEGYGLTETSSSTTVNDPDDFRFGTVGRAVDGTEIRLDEDGEILVRSDTVFAGYYKEPEATEPRPSPRTAGSARATSARSTRTASSRSPTARRT